MIGRGKNDDHLEVNVRVIVRCRPFTQHEKKDPTQYQVVHPKPATRELLISQIIPGRKAEKYSKTYNFDGVCNQDTTQLELFNGYVVPIVEEVLQGFNCTIFAYGQTGTGKTYTMEGDSFEKPQLKLNKDNGDSFNQCDTCSICDSSDIARPKLSLSDDAGIIPRAVKYIFEKLELQEAEYSVRASYLEIYNEELNDLLNDGEKQNLRIFEDNSSKKGLAVDRLEEVAVTSPQDILNILSIAVKKRRTAETLLNRQSSRSHSIFSLTIHMKETNIEGEDVIKIGKLNLVDLAGSENIQKSGANSVKNRAKEAGMINQSLLTLGRVINALVEHSSYIPYRDSKLTRLLQDSLGGRTKTCIVATISPSSVCVEETFSTLDYAFRAKNIRNRPEVNQKMTKRVMIRELNKELEKLRCELAASREKNGVYVPYDQFTEMENKIATQNMELSEATHEIKMLKEKVDQMSHQVNLFNNELQVEIDQKNQFKMFYESLNAEYSNMILNYNKLKSTFEESSRKYASNEQKIQYIQTEIEPKLKSTYEELDFTTEELKSLQNTTSLIIDKIHYISDEANKIMNDQIMSQLHHEYNAWVNFFNKYIDEYSAELSKENNSVRDRLIIFENLSETLISNLHSKYTKLENSIVANINKYVSFYNNMIQSIKKHISDKVSISVKNVSNIFVNLQNSVSEISSNVINKDLNELKNTNENFMTQYSTLNSKIKTNIQNLSSDHCFNTKNIINTQLLPMQANFDSIMKKSHHFQESITDTVKTFMESIQNSVEMHSKHVMSECTHLMNKQNEVAENLIQIVDTTDTVLSQNIDINNILNDSVLTYKKETDFISSSIKNKLKKCVGIIKENTHIEQDVLIIEEFLDHYLPNQLKIDQKSIIMDETNKENIPSLEISEESKSNIGQILTNIPFMFKDYKSENKKSYEDYKNSICAVKSNCDEVLAHIQDINVENLISLEKTNEKLAKREAVLKKIYDDFRKLFATLKLQQGDDMADQLKKSIESLQDEYNNIYSIINQINLLDSQCTQESKISQDNSTKNITSNEEDSIKTPKQLISSSNNTLEINGLYFSEINQNERSKNFSITLNNEVLLGNKGPSNSIETPIPTPYNLESVIHKNTAFRESSSQSLSTENYSLVPESQPESNNDELLKNIMDLQSKTTRSKKQSNNNKSCGISKNDIIRTNSDPASYPKSANQSKNALLTPKTSALRSKNTFYDDLSSSSSSYIEFKSSSMLTSIGKKKSKNHTMLDSLSRKKPEVFAQSSFQEPTKLTQINTRKKYTSNRHCM